MKSGVCPRCGSTYVMSGLQVRQQSARGMPNQDVGVALTAPGSRVATSYHPATGWACASCGYLELDLDAPGDVWQLRSAGHA